MRQLTRDQIAAIGSGIDKVLIGPGKNWHTINIYPETDCENKIRQYLIDENKDLPEETRQHINYLTSHPTLIVEISLPCQPPMKSAKLA